MAQSFTIRRREKTKRNVYRSFFFFLSLSFLVLAPKVPFWGQMDLTEGKKAKGPVTAT